MTSMDAPPRPNAAGSAAEQAASWFARHRSGDWGATDEAAFTDWLRRDPAHAEAWARQQQLWSRLDAVRDDPRVLAMREAALQRAAQAQSVRHRGWRFAAIAAGVAIVGLVAWQLPRRPNTTTDGATVASVPAAPTAAGRSPAQVHDAATRIGERLEQTLADGSRVTLNTDSAIHVDFTGRERRVTLVRGEAFFEVAKDPTRPFVVAAASRRVVAVGTAFAVRMQAQQLRVTLVEGRVRVIGAAAAPAAEAAPGQAAVANPGPGAGATGAAAPIELEPGSALIADASGAARVERLDAGLATSWRTGRLVFDDQPLAEVVAEMNRYSVQRLEIATPALGRRRVSGVFEATGGAAFAAALETYGIVRSTRTSPTTLLLTEGRP